MLTNNSTNEVHSCTFHFCTFISNFSQILYKLQETFEISIAQVKFGSELLKLFGYSHIFYITKSDVHFI